MVEREDEGERWRRVNLIKIYCKHIYKYHNASPVKLLYANK
jgi:hypothetical protein